MHGPERVVHVHVAELGERGAERGHGLVSAPFPFFLRVEAKVLEEDDGASCWVGARSFDFSSHAILEESDGFAEEFLQTGGDTFEGHRGHDLALCVSQEQVGIVQRDSVDTGHVRHGACIACCGNKQQQQQQRAVSSA